MKLLLFASVVLVAFYVVWSTGHLDDVANWCVRKAKDVRYWLRRR